MRKSVCEKLENYSGYIGTNQLLKAGVTNRQIGTLTAEGALEKVCYGSFRRSQPFCQLPPAGRTEEPSK